MSTISDALNAAADIIETKGHVKGACISPSGAQCTLQAMETGSRGVNKLFQDCEARFRRVNNVDNVISWNDEPDRTQEEVIAALRLAAHE